MNIENSDTVAAAEQLAFVRIWVNAVFLVDVATTSFRSLGNLPVEIMHPPGIMEYFSWKFYDRLITPAGMQCLQIVLAASLAASLAGAFTRYATKTSLALVVLYQGILRSFGHFNHDEMAGIYILAVLAFVPCGDMLSIDSWLRLRPGALRPAIFYTYPVFLMQAILAWIYFSTGMLKLWLGGRNYFSPDQLPVLAIKHSLDNMHDTHFRLAFLLPSISSLTTWMLILVVVWEITFPIGVYYRKTRWWYLGFGIIFHVSTMLLMNIAFWNHLAMYAVFVNFGTIRDAFQKRLCRQYLVPVI